MCVLSNQRRKGNNPGPTWQWPISPEHFLAVNVQVNLAVSEPTLQNPLGPQQHQYQWSLCEIKWTFDPSERSNSDQREFCSGKSESYSLSGWSTCLARNMHQSISMRTQGGWVKFGLTEEVSKSAKFNFNLSKLFGGNSVIWQVDAVNSFKFDTLTKDNLTKWVHARALHMWTAKSCHFGPLGGCNVQRFKLSK